MQKVLYISDYLSIKNVGAHQLTISHLKSLQDIFGEENVDVVNLSGNHYYEDIKYLTYSSYSNNLQKLKNMLFLYTPYLNKKIEACILNQVKKEKYNLVFIDNSIYGKMIKKIKKIDSSIKVVTFYHDVKKNLARQWLKEYGVRFLPEYITILYNEKLTTLFSDKNITLNHRESLVLQKLYCIKSDLELPIYLQDKLHITHRDRLNESKKLKLLFVGAYYYPNVQGVVWFVKEVMSQLDPKEVELYIVGRDMEKLLLEIDSKYLQQNIKIIGSVDSLSEWYEKSDIVIAPIFSGAGMKVKTAEALMYGKLILGTTEALEGYHDSLQSIDDSQGFINKINDIIKCNEYSHFNLKMRKLYEDYYSVESANAKLKELFNQLLN